MTEAYRPRIAYYADDFTGATDALERLVLGGLSTRLFLAPPSEQQLAQDGWPEAVGIAGRTRSLPTAEIEAEVRPVFERLREMRPHHVHYKVCSTFDSSPTIGSIGRVIDVAAEVFEHSLIPVVVGSPTLGRWVAFGNLFAGVGIGAESDAYRLDRHPTMAHHPVTPADEADLRICLSRQTEKPIGLIDLRELELPLNRLLPEIQSRYAGETGRVVVFDTLSDTHLAKIGAVLESFAGEGRPIFSVGSSAVESALTAHWGSSMPVSADAASDVPRPALVLVGSCSRVTARQVELARAAGVAELRIDPASLDVEAIIPIVNESLAARRTVVVSSGGADQSKGGEALPAERLGAAFARIATACRETLADGVLLVAGGDTASYTVRSLGIESITMESPFISGAPLCQMWAPGHPCDGLRVVLKGGQVGKPDLFARLAGVPTEVIA